MRTPCSACATGPGPHDASAVGAADGGAAEVAAAAFDAAAGDADGELDELGPGGLMKDSVLEIKWKAERAKNSSAPTSAESCSACAEGGSTIRPISDPATSYQFTRIAAPTALLGRNAPQPLPDDVAAALEAESVAPPPLSAVSPSLSRPTKTASGAAGAADDAGRVGEQARSAAAEAAVEEFRRRRWDAALRHAMPYSPTSLALRGYWYMQAQRNRTQFLDLFCGEFDNYEQVAAQRAAGVLPREGGGHEHIHCSLTPLAGDMLFARYYFNGDPSVVFRSRLYKVLASDASDRGLLEMRIFRFYEETERRLKASNYDIGALEWDDDDLYDWLQGCEVYWERYALAAGDADDASAALGIEPGPRFVGYMKGGGCELYSREISGRIRVMDDLLLTGSDLWVSDRGFDEAGHFVYGNRRGLPYQMKRVDRRAGRADPAWWTLSSSTPPPPGYVS